MHKPPPTREELDAIPVSDNDVKEYLAGLARIEKALQKARIPASLEWAFVIMNAAAQALVILGISRELFEMFADASFGGALGRLSKPGKLPSEMPDLGKLEANLAARVSRLFGALNAARIDLADPDTCPLLLGVAAAEFARNALPLEMFVTGCDAAYTDAETRITAMGKKSQA